MIIFKGVGVLIVVLFVGFHLLFGWMMGEEMEDHALHFSLSFFVTGLTWFGFYRRVEKSIVQGTEAEQALLRPEQLDDKTRKRAQQLAQVKKLSGMYLTSNLFFIHVKWWPYVLGGLSVVFLVLHFT